MARPINKLTAKAAKSLSRPGRYGDGAGLWLVISDAGTKRWAFLFRQQGRLREMGLGSVSVVTLAEAREAAHEARRCIRAGGDPIAERRTKRSKRIMATTFGAFADELAGRLGPSFRAPRHGASWLRSMKVEAAELRPLALEVITTDHVLRVLKPRWHSSIGPRLRMRIERVLAAAKVAGLRHGENPAAWRGHLKELLTPPKPPRHFAAMPYEEIPGFVERLREMQSAGSMIALALEFMVLTATRSMETIGARWDELDLQARAWTIPADRMKSKRAHTVPLTVRAMEVIAEAERLRRDSDNPYVFQGMKRRKSINQIAFLKLMARMDIEDATPHGFRSSFRDFAGNETHHAREVCEEALSHVVGDSTERAYRRGNALERRRKLMEEWAAFIAGEQLEAVASRAVT